ncbi:MAG: hypothetical protein D6704_00480 [Nitrospirae bacterium]|nr:MAG: hypothetical protein D6704_00480 [Nitrospirota bacterium]
MISSVYPQSQPQAVLVSRLLLVWGMLVVLLLSGLPAAAESPSLALTALNIRLSHRPVHPPEQLIRRSFLLPEIRAARALVGPSPQAAILEDDQRHRVAILSILDDGRIRADLLIDLDLIPYFPDLVSCARERECAYDRRPLTGGLACVAICLQRVLDPSAP